MRTSTIDVDHVPTYKPVGKPITQVDIDEGTRLAPHDLFPFRSHFLRGQFILTSFQISDLKQHEKPWRLPGTDVSDFFNYGFDEFTWTLYCLKQDKTRAQVQEDKKDFTSGMMGADGAGVSGGSGIGGMPPFAMPGMPGMPGVSGMPANLLPPPPLPIPISIPGGPAAGLPPPNQAMPTTSLPMMPPPPPGMADMPPEMQAMMAQMMASGMDPSQLAQMDPATMFGITMQQQQLHHQQQQQGGQGGGGGGGGGRDVGR